MVTRLIPIFSFVLVACTSGTHAMNSNFFEQGVQLRAERLLKIFNPVIKVFTMCSENLQENPGVENFQANFEVINSAYKNICKKIQKDPTILLEFMELKDTDLIKGKIEIIQRFFVDFEQAIAVNNPSCRLLDVQQEQNSLEHILGDFMKNKHHCDALACGKMQELEALQSMSHLSACGIEIAVQPDVGDDEKLAQALQLQLNLELMHEREAREQEQQKANLICESSNIEIIEYSDENFSPQALVNDQRCKKGTRIFSGATNDTQFIAQLKQIINHVDITQDLDQGVFDRLSAQVPSSFSMLMNREIGRASRYDVMQHNFGEPPITSYAHYFPECLMVGDDEGAEARVSMLEGHANWVNCMKQLSDGRLVSCSNDKTIKVWDLNANRCVGTLEGHTDLVGCIKQLSDSRLASASDDGTIKLWDLNTNKCVATLEGHTRFVSCINQLDDRRLVSGSFDGTIKVWDLNTNRCVGTLESYTDLVFCIKQLDDGRLASCSNDKTIKLWNLYPDLSFEQIALVVQLERCYQEDNRINLGYCWRDVFETLPDYFQKHFRSVVG